MHQTILDLLGRIGPPFLFFAQIFGIFGVPVPDEVLLILAGALVRHGQLNGSATVAAAIAGCSGGITLSFVLGRTIGVAALHHRALRRHHAALARAERWFRRFGVWLLAFGYFVPGVRHVSAITAGSTSLEYYRFARAAYPGAVLWCSVFLSIGYYAGDRWEQIARVMPDRPVILAIALVATGIIFVIATRGGEGLGLGLGKLGIRNWELGTRN